jgi:CO dehydrogenase/acetyl-CoA synthase alpha subunit
MGVAAQLRQLKYPREIRLEKGEEAAGSGAIVWRRSGESLNPGVQDLRDWEYGLLAGRIQLVYHARVGHCDEYL